MVFPDFPIIDVHACCYVGTIASAGLIFLLFLQRPAPLGRKYKSGIPPCCNN